METHIGDTSGPNKGDSSNDRLPIVFYFYSKTIGKSLNMYSLTVVTDAMAMQIAIRGERARGVYIKQRGEKLEPHAEMEADLLFLSSSSVASGANPPDRFSVRVLGPFGSGEVPSMEFAHATLYVRVHVDKCA